MKVEMVVLMDDFDADTVFENSSNGEGERMILLIVST
jgi:hypothetical protein